MNKKLLACLLAAEAGVVGVGEYFFKYAMTTYKKKPDSKKLMRSDPFYEDKVWFNKFDKENWLLKTKKGLTLHAEYLNHNSKKTAIILHGFMSYGEGMGAFAKMFYDLGFNVLLPDARAHGESGGKYIGYGWVEKEDILNWINQVIKRTGENSQIVVMGQSMGGATAMMVSGMKLPPQVKAFIEDCGYSSVKKELTYQAGTLANIPHVVQFPVIEALSFVNKIKNGFFVGQASSVKQLKRNTRPFLFIHGGKDHFVPTEMVYENYSAANCPKELWIAPLAGHAMSFPMYKTQYKNHIQAFLEKYGLLNK